MTERTLVFIKPDAVLRGLVGEIISRFERKGLVIEAMRLRTMDTELSNQHYFEHVEKAFYPSLREFMTAGPLVSLVLSGDQAIEVVRAMTGATDGRKAVPGTIRGDFCPCRSRRMSCTLRILPAVPTGRSHSGSRN